MNDALFTQIKHLSLELRSLIRQGVREGVDERIQERNRLMQEWFGKVSELIDLTNEQQLFLEELLQEERELLAQLQAEQKQIGSNQQGQKNVKKYLM